MTTLVLLGIAGARLVLFDFESDEELAKWATEEKQFEMVLVEEHATSGKKALKFVAKEKAPWPGVSTTEFSRDWSAFDVLRADLYNPQDRPIPFDVRIDDVDSRDYATWYDKTLTLAPGRNLVEIKLSGLLVHNRKRTIRLDAVKMLVYFTLDAPAGTAFYIDNVRLEKLTGAPDVRPFFAFDFGLDSSPVCPGFTKVTETTKYSPERGWGWKGHAIARDRVHPNALFGDWVASDEGEFVLDLPEGAYFGWCMLEDSSWWEGYHNWLAREVRAEGRVVFREERTVGEFFEQYWRHMWTEDVPGEDVWDIYVEPRYRARTFEACVADGRLNLQFRGERGWAKCPVSALVICRSEDAGAVLPWLEGLMRGMKDDFRREHVELPHEVEIAEPVPDEIDRERGYVVFSRSYMADVYPNSRPRDGERTVYLTASCARDEAEPLTFSIYPRRELGVCTACVTPLIDERGDALPADALKLSHVRYKLRRFGLGGTAPRYEVAPRFLMPLETVEIRKGATRRFWLTLKIPRDARAGAYTARVLFVPEKGLPTDIRIRVEVRPFVLEECASVLVGNHYGYGHTAWGRFEETREKGWKLLEEEARDMREHGFTVAEVSAYDDDIPRAFDILKRAGFKKLRYILGYREWEKREARAKRILELAEKNAWPPVEFFIFSEITNVGAAGLEEGVKALKDARSLKEKDARFRYIAGLNHEEALSLLPYADMVDVNAGLPLGPELFERIADAGVEAYIYNSGKDRLSNGFWLWQSRVGTKIEFCYDGTNCDPFYDLDGREADNGLAFPSPLGPLPIPNFERMREGIDDLRYCAMLDSLIKRADEAKEREFAELGRAALEVALEGVNPVLRENAFYRQKYGNYDAAIYLPLGQEEKVAGSWTQRDFDRRRAIVAKAIEYLVELLRE